MKSLLDKINAKLNAQGGFLKAVSVLVGGTAFAQLIGFIFLPILTRLYTPEDYSVLGVYVAVVSILAVISCLRFDIAIPIPKDDGEGKALLLLSLISNSIFFVLLYVLLFIIYPFIQSYKIIQQLSYWVWLIPFGVYISGLYSALQYWATRHKRFKDIAQTRMTQSISGNATSLTTGYVWGGFWGLILGQILNFSGGLFKLAISAKKDLSHIKSSSLKGTFSKYSNFPKYSTFEALANTSAIQLPLIIIASFIIGPEVGYLMMAMKIMGIPMSLIGGSVSQVYLAESPKMYEMGKLRDYTQAIMKKLLNFSGLIIIGSTLLYILVPYILGEKWKRTADLIVLMAPWFVIQFIASPISMVMHIKNMQKTMLILTITGLLLRILSMYFAFVFCTNLIVEAYILSNFIFYFLCYYIFSRVVGFKLKDHFNLIKENPFFLYTSIYFFIFGVFLY